MTKFSSSLLFIIILISSISCQKKVTPEIEKYTISIDSIRKSIDVSGYDTIWFSVSPKDGKKPIVIVDPKDYESNYRQYANPNVVKATDTYLVLSRDFPEYQNIGTIQLTLLAYGTRQSSVTASYVTSKATSSTLNGKILFRTSSYWVLWDLKTNKAISTASSSLDVVDYNSTTGQILVRSGSVSYLYYYNENFTVYNNYYIANLSYYTSNWCFLGTSNTVSYFNSYDDLGHLFTPPSTNTTTALESSYYSMYQFNASEYAHAHIMYSSFNSYYYIRYSINNGSYKIAATSYYDYFKNIEISKDGKYLLYTYNNELRLFNTGTQSSINTSNYTNIKPCFDNSFSKVCFIDTYNRLAIYDIDGKTTSYPLDGTAYGSNYIYQAYW